MNVDHQTSEQAKRHMADEDPGTVPGCSLQIYSGTRELHGSGSNQSTVEVGIVGGWTTLLHIEIGRPEHYSGAPLSILQWQIWGCGGEAF